MSFYGIMPSFCDNDVMVVWSIHFIKKKKKVLSASLQDGIFHTSFAFCVFIKGTCKGLNVYLVDKFHFILAESGKTTEYKWLRNSQLPILIEQTFSFLIRFVEDSSVAQMGCLFPPVGDSIVMEMYWQASIALWKSSVSLILAAVSLKLLQT